MAANMKRSSTSLSMNPTGKPGLWTRKNKRDTIVFVLCCLLAMPGDACAQTKTGQIRRASEGTRPANTTEAVGRLQEILQKPERMMRERKAAIVSLGKLGPAAASALPLLEKELTNRDVTVAYEAYRSIGLIRNEPLLTAAELREGTVDVLFGHNGYRALRALREGTLPAGVTLAMLRAFLMRQPPAPQHLMALEIIASLRPADLQTVSTVLQSISSTNEVVATNAAVALGQCSLTDSRVVDELARTLVSGGDFVAIESAKTLARLGPRAAQYAPSLVEALRGKTGTNNFRRLGAYLHVLRAIGPEAAPVASDLAKLLPENAPIYQGLLPFYARSVRRYVLLTLSEIGVPPEAVPVIIDELSTALEPPMIATAARAAGGLTAAPEKVVPFLTRALTEKGLDVAVRLETIEVKTPGFSGTETSPYLEIIRALERLGPAAKEAVPALRMRARDSVRRSGYSPPYQKEAGRVAEKLSL
jgi:HEAT repeat protein